VLHLGQNVSEMLTVLAALAMPGMRPILGTLQRRLGRIAGAPLDSDDVRWGDAGDLRQLPLGQATSLARLGELETEGEPGAGTPGAARPVQESRWPSALQPTR